MAIGDLKSQKGIEALNQYLEDKIYVEGYQPTQADIAVFYALGTAPSDATPHALRWYKHITSYSNEEKKKLPGEKKIPASFGSAEAAPAKDDDDDSEEDAEAARIREERLKAYSEKSKKPALIAKSRIVLDVKPWYDETDMQAMEAKVRTRQMDGLVWGASKLVPVGYGINKLQVMCVVEDEKVSVDLLAEEIQALEDHVQSVDIAAFNKI